MGSQIIQERTPYLFAIFSTNTDTFVARHLTERQVVEFFVEQHRDSVEHEVKRATNLLKDGGKPYFQFTLSLEEAEKLHEEHS